VKRNVIGSAGTGWLGVDSSLQTAVLMSGEIGSGIEFLHQAPQFSERLGMLHGVGTDGGLSMIQAARLTAPQKMNGFPPKLHPIPHHWITESGSFKQSCDFHAGFSKLRS
jgi:hypothetical protein